MELVIFLRDWIIPVLSVLITIWFAAQAKKDAQKSEGIQKQISDAISTWQNDIMNVATQILRSNPQIVEAEVKLADAKTRNEALELLAKTIKEQLDQQDSPAARVAAFNAIASTLQKLS